MLFNWISRCWGGMGVTTRFQKARVNSCIADWTVPYQDDILTIITTFQDKNPQIPAKTAINTFFSHLQTDEERGHPAFLLKNLYILDHCVQQMTALDTIGYYYNSNLTNPQSSKNLEGLAAQSPLKQLINAYYAYIKTKARNYTYYETTFFGKQLICSQKSIQPIISVQKSVRTYDQKMEASQISLDNKGVQSMLTSSKKKKRQYSQQQKSIHRLFMQQRKQKSFSSIFNIIQKCQQIQKHIIQINKSYLMGNKKVQLIQFIFIMILKTFIRCYIIVSVGIRYLFQQFMNMNYSQLQKFIKSFQYFNGDYTAQFIKFVQNNKNQINIYKEINYNQLTFLSKDNMRILLQYQLQIKQRQQLKRKNSLDNSVSPIKPLSFLQAQQIQQTKIIELPHEVQLGIKQNMKIFYKPRKNMDYCLQTVSKRQIQDPITYNDNVSSDDMPDKFFEYLNFYHTDFNLIPQQVDMTSSSHSNRLRVNNNSACKKQREKSSNKEQKEASQAPNKLRQQLGDLTIHHTKSVEVPINKFKFKSSAITQGSSKQNQNIKILAKSRQRMLQIKQMFNMQEKQSKTNDKWEEWENIYANDSLALKN